MPRTVGMLQPVLPEIMLSSKENTDAELRLRKSNKNLLQKKRILKPRRWFRGLEHLSTNIKT